MRSPGNEGFRSARHVSALFSRPIPSEPFRALSSRSFSWTLIFFSPEGCPCSHPAPSGPWITERFSLTAISTRAVLQRPRSRPIELLLRVPPVFDLLSKRETRRACMHVCLRYRHMLVSAALCRHTTFKFSKATTFRIPRIYVCRKERKSPSSLAISILY